MRPTLPFRTPAQPIAALALMTASSQSAGLNQFAYEFDILRNGSPVGHHELRISRGDAETRVFALSDIKVTFMGFTVYRMRYHSEEVWDEEGLKALAVDVDDDGQIRRIDGQRQDDYFHWMRPDGSENSMPLPVYPTNHWNPSVLGASRVLNTLTGESNQVEVTTVPAAAAFPLANNSQGAATAYQYSGDLNLTSWYDPQGRWIGMRFKGRDGSDIEYVCRNCGDGLAL